MSGYLIPPPAHLVERHRWETTVARQQREATVRAAQIAAEAAAQGMATVTYTY